MTAYQRRQKAARGILANVACRGINNPAARLDELERLDEAEHGRDSESVRRRQAIADARALVRNGRIAA